MIANAPEQCERRMGMAERSESTILWPPIAADEAREGICRMKGY